MKNSSSISMQSFWMFVLGLVAGVLLVLGVMLAQGSSDKGSADLFRWNYDPYVSTDVYQDLNMDTSRGSVDAVRGMNTIDPVSGITPTL